MTAAVDPLKQALAERQDALDKGFRNAMTRVERWMDEAIAKHDLSAEAYNLVHSRLRHFYFMDLDNRAPSAWRAMDNIGFTLFHRESGSVQYLHNGGVVSPHSVVQIRAPDTAPVGGPGPYPKVALVIDSRAIAWRWA